MLSYFTTFCKENENKNRWENKSNLKLVRIFTENKVSSWIEISRMQSFSAQLSRTICFSQLFNISQEIAHFVLGHLVCMLISWLEIVSQWFWLWFCNHSLRLPTNYMIFVQRFFLPELNWPTNIWVHEIISRICLFECLIL